MKIPDKAVDTLIDSLGWRIVDSKSGAARIALEAVHPFIAAQALRDAASGVYHLDDEDLDTPHYVVEFRAYLEDLADRLDPN